MSKSDDPTEPARRVLVAEINSAPHDRASLEEQHGRVWDTDQMREEFIAEGFMAPFVVVRRKSDGAQGTLEFCHSPRFYFNWQAD